jgi:hypothetical protein
MGFKWLKWEGELVANHFPPPPQCFLKIFKVRVRVTLRRAVYHQSVSLGDKPLETTSNFVFQLNTCRYSPYLTSFPTKGQVCRLQLYLILASTVILRSESCGTHDHILLSQIQDLPQPVGSGPHIYIP